MTTLSIAAILLVLAALGGLTMVAIRLTKNVNPPTVLAVGHGLIAAGGLLTLIYTAMTTAIPDYARWSIYVFIAAALGGLAMFLLFHRQGRLLPIPIMLGHGLLGISGIAMLLMAIYR